MARILAAIAAVNLCWWIALAIPTYTIAADVAADDMREGAVPRKALVIGVRRYKHWDEVPSAELDAKTIADRLKISGFDVTPSIDDTTEDIYDKLRTFAKKLEPNDVAVIYYSGHGFQYEGLNYLTATDTPKPLPMEKLLYYTVPVDDLVNRMRVRNVGFTLLLIDACRDNQNFVALPDGTTKSLGGTGMTRPAEPPPQLVIGFATFFGKVAFSSSSPDENSIYTRFLGEQFNRLDVELLELLREVGIKVHLKRDDQSPQTHYTVAGNFFLRPDARARVEERTFWINALQNRTPDAVRDFLMHWPAGLYAGAARAWLARTPSTTVFAAAPHEITTNFNVLPVSNSPGATFRRQTVTRIDPTETLQKALPNLSGVATSSSYSMTAKELVGFSRPDLNTGAEKISGQTPVRIVKPCATSVGGACVSEIEVREADDAARRLWVKGAFTKTTTTTDFPASESIGLQVMLHLTPISLRDIESNKVRVQSAHIAGTSGQDARTLNFGADTTLDRLPALLVGATGRTEAQISLALRSALADARLGSEPQSVQTDGEPPVSRPNSLRYLRGLQIRNIMEGFGLEARSLVVREATKSAGTLNSGDIVRIVLPKL